jgi:hypothetical protein
VPTGQLGAIFCLLQILIGLDLRRAQLPSPVADVAAGPQRVCCRGQRDVVLILAERLPCDHPEQQDERGRQHDLRALCPWAAIDRVIVWCENVRRYAVSGAMIRLSV